MSNVLTLDDINNAADEKFANLEIPLPSGKTAVLVNALQLPRDKRKELGAFQEDSDENGDTVDVLEAAVRVAGYTTPDETDELLVLLDGNLAKLIELFARYSTGTQVGEA